jgi:hypothetical protein
MQTRMTSSAHYLGAVPTLLADMRQMRRRDRLAACRSRGEATTTLTARARRALQASFAEADTENRELAAEMAEFYADPLGFVRYAYPWGEPGPLEHYAGPDQWQEESLRVLGDEIRSRNFDGYHAVLPIRLLVSSGHGIGKGTWVAWVATWILSTRANSQGTATANTFPQLESKTWATIQRWLKMCLTRPWFQIGNDRIYRNGQAESWFLRPLTAQENKSESFSGQHAASSTSYYLFDEASAISPAIWEVAEGGLTDGEPIFIALGNPTRNRGTFFESAFGRSQHRWIVRCIDSRESAFANKATIAEWEQTYGEDSDFFRVRVRGIAPRAGDLQFIDSERIWDAQKRKTPEQAKEEPLVCGVDVARGGDDSTVICFRRGVDAVSIRAEKIPGEQMRDLTLLVSKLSLLLSEGIQGQRIAMMFLDGSGVGAGLYHRLKQLGYEKVTEIQFGSAAPDHKHFANMRAWMWSRLKDWLQRGSIPPDNSLELDLSGPGYFHDKQDRLCLESKDDMKKRGLASTDYGDALALTFAQSVAPTVSTLEKLNPVGGGTQFSWGSSASSSSRFPRMGR